MLNNTKYIFTGISDSLFSFNNSPQKNLAMLQESFQKIGVNIHPSCIIQNSTLQMLIKLINGTLLPEKIMTKEEILFIRKFDMNLSGARIAMDLINAKRDMNMLINISQGVRIGKNVKLYSSISIGNNTTIGNFSEIITGAKIGSNCKLGNSVLLHYDSIIEDNVTIDNSTIILAKSFIQRNSHIVHTSMGDFSFKKNI